MAQSQEWMGCGTSQPAIVGSIILDWTLKANTAWNDKLYAFVPGSGRLCPVDTTAAMERSLLGREPGLMVPKLGLKKESEEEPLVFPFSGSSSSASKESARPALDQAVLLTTSCLAWDRQLACPWSLRGGQPRHLLHPPPTSWCWCRAYSCTQGLGPRHTALDLVLSSPEASPEAPTNPSC